MPAVPKSYLPALAAFIALSFTYTAVNAQREGAHVDAARTRWYSQKERGLAALSHGATLEQRH
ncbi:hypothetical protein EJ04DRAFT_434550 [Polyplosphaeria fusca]|uniref:Uncharacterized protein n=1 Tax=Polyplosphaeria fusca TaxID=682080 RepID=A0A9P4V3T4_9PLEO|nr:hypothetical protein EJ04DRAFT_434550 [Polyplosphaeria fusca]